MGPFDPDTDVEIIRVGQPSDTLKVGTPDVPDSSTSWYLICPLKGCTLKNFSVCVGSVISGCFRPEKVDKVPKDLLNV